MTNDTLQTISTNQDGSGASGLATLSAPSLGETTVDNSLTIQAGVVSKLGLDLPELVAKGKTKVKQTNRAFRIWIEGTKLVKAGFDSSVAYTIDYDVEGGTIFLIIDPKGERKVTASRPIIDLHDQKVGEVFDAGDQIEVQYFDNGVIRFRRAI